MTRTLLFSLLALCAAGCGTEYEGFKKGYADGLRKGYELGSEAPYVDTVYVSRVDTVWITDTITAAAMFEDGRQLGMREQALSMIQMGMVKDEYMIPGATNKLHDSLAREREKLEQQY